MAQQGWLPLATAILTITKYDSNDPNDQNNPNPNLHTYPISSINALGQETDTTYFYTLGLPYKVNDPNSWLTKTTYDGLGRLYR